MSQKLPNAAPIPGSRPPPPAAPPKPTQCIACSHWSLRKTPREMAKLGFAVCEIKSLQTSQTFAGIYKRDCDRFAAASSDVVAKRTKFLEHKEVNS